MNWTKIGVTALIGLCAVSGIGGVIVAGMIIFTRATSEPPSTPSMTPTMLTTPAVNGSPTSK